MRMKPYDADYTWEEVKEAVNRCLLVIYNKRSGDQVKEIFNNGLPLAMNTVARQVFIYGDYVFSSIDMTLIRDAFKQLDSVGYIGMQEVTELDTRK